METKIIDGLSKQEMIENITNLPHEEQVAGLIKLMDSVLQFVESRTDYLKAQNEVFSEIFTKTAEEITKINKEILQLNFIIDEICKERGITRERT
jgi:uncharacterized coiled-coil DUF342 family protein